MSSEYRALRGRFGGLVLVTLGLSAAVPAAGQGRRSDYERSAKLRTLTQGRASWSMEPLSYEPMPPVLQRELLRRHGYLE